MTARLVLTDRNDDRGRPIWQLLDHYRVELAPGTTITVPAGTETNFGSIPWYCEWLVSSVSMREAALVHDWMCDERFFGSEFFDMKPSGFSRWMADAVLHEMLTRQRFPWWKRLPVYFAVRLWAYVSRQYLPAPPEPIECPQEPAESVEARKE